MTLRNLAPTLLVFLLPTVALAGRPDPGDRLPIVDGPHSRVARDDVIRPPLGDVQRNEEWIQRAVQRAVGKTDPTGGGPDRLFLSTGTHLAV